MVARAFVVAGLGSRCAAPSVASSPSSSAGCSSMLPSDNGSAIPVKKASRVSMPVGMKRDGDGDSSDDVDDADDWLSRAASASAADTVNTRSKMGCDWG